MVKRGWRVMFLNISLHAPQFAVTFYRGKSPSKLRFWAVSVTLGLSISTNNIFKVRNPDSQNEYKKTRRTQLCLEEGEIELINRL